MNVSTLRPGDPAYPHLLSSIFDPPKSLSVWGRIPDTGGLAIVGARRASTYGLRMARLLARRCAQAGIPTVSGLARGIDTAVAEGTLEGAGAHWAILGSGLSKIYPAENAALAERIVEQGGAILSEFGLSDAPLRGHFPQRNRIISGLSWATLVVEGDEDSGALITADFATQEGREVLAVPGPVDSRLSRAPLKLIRNGAAIVACWEDVLEAVPQLAACARRPAEEAVEAASEENGLLADQRRVMRLLGTGETAWEELFETARLPVDRLAVVLLELEMEGRIRSCPGQRYAKV